MVAQSALPAPGVAELQRLFDLGCYEDVIGSTTSSYPHGDLGRIQLIQARAYLRIDTNDARTQATLLVSPLLETRFKAEALLVLGLGAARGGDTTLARDYLFAAVRISEDTDLLAEIHWAIALSEYLDANYDPSSFAMCAAMRTKNPALIAKGYYLQAFMYYGRSCNADFIRLLIRAAKQFSSVQYPEAETLASISMNLVCIGSELGDTDAVAVGEQMYRSLEESVRLYAGIEEHQHITLRGIAWYQLLQGDTECAAYSFRKASERAPSEAYRVLSLAERAVIAQACNERAWASDILREAQEHYERVDWLKTTVQEPLALTTLAGVWAQKDPDQAKTFADLFVVVQKLQRERQGANYKRYNAMYDMALAKQLASAGETQAAIKLLVSVYDDFTALSFVWRAGEALIELGKLTHDLESVKRGRDQVAKVYPKSLIVADADCYLALAKFTPTERRVISALIGYQSSSSEQVASDLHMAIGTLNKHIAHITEKLGSCSGRKGITSFFEQTGLTTF
jgi:hypothetical protein